jgi:hypothetical protein
MLNALGLYAHAEYLRDDCSRRLAAQRKRFVSAETLRVALDAVAI